MPSLQRPGAGAVSVPPDDLLRALHELRQRTDRYTLHSTADVVAQMELLFYDEWQVVYALRRAHKANMVDLTTVGDKSWWRISSAGMAELGEPEEPAEPPPARPPEPST